MSPLDQNDVDFGRSKSKVQYFSKKNELQPGKSVVVKVVEVEKNTQTKYPIMGQNFTYRFTLEDGRVWDESTASLFGKLIKILYPDGKTFQAAEVKLSMLVSKPIKGSQYTVDKA